MKYFFLILLFIVPVFCFAHDGTDSTSGKKEYKNEFGLDMVYFLHIFRNQYEPSNGNTMVFAFDRHFKHERIGRFFLSAGFLKYVTRQDTVAAIYNQQSDLIALPGFGWERHIGKHWAYFYGMQAKIENASGRDTRGDNNTTGVRITYFNNWFYGPSGFTGIKFRINERISIQTEMDIGFIFYSTESGFRNEKFSSQNYTTFISGFNTEYDLPRTVLLNFMF